MTPKHKRYARAMLAWLPPLYFFTVLMGSPVPGFLVFMLIGIAHAWQSWRKPHSANAFQWTRQDTWLALCFMSIPLFKLLTLLWSADAKLVLGNVVGHLYFLFWPLVLLGLSQCKGAPQNHIDRAVALGLITVTLWRLAFDITGLNWLDHGSPNRGILAQLTLVAGAWNLLALTRPDKSAGSWRKLYLLASLCTFVLLVHTERRLELLGFVLMTTSILVWRGRARLTPLKLTGLLAAAAALLAMLVYLRWDLFARGVDELNRYLNAADGARDISNSSWGARLEMWRLGIAAFLDHPWLGLGASAQPSSMQAWGGPPAEIFGHRHFHAQWLQILVEGGLLGASIAITTLSWIIRTLVLQPLKTREETSLLAATLMMAYMIEGTASAALHYDKPNALMVVASAWIWSTLRHNRLSASS